MSKTETIARAILREVRANPNITIQSLEEQLEYNDVGGWLDVPEVLQGNNGTWAGAMALVIHTLKQENHHGDTIAIKHA